MRLSMLLFLITTMPLPALAVQPRCGNDAFGNIVCMDRDGVLSTKPVKAKPNQQGQAIKSKPGAGEKAEEVRSGESGNEADTPAVRCGTDPFGNTVCR
ncbi:MAG: hypothetical protein PXX77_07230 [Gallionella sp.]|nr:hypothetical protein [Gallionella sp.]